MKARLLNYKNGRIVEASEGTIKRWIERGIPFEPIESIKIEKTKFKLHDKVSIVILVKDALEYFKMCFESVIKYTFNYELIIVDNGSSSLTKKYLTECPAKFTLITNKENKGFSYGNNQGIKIAESDWICFLNSDTFVTPDWLPKLQKCFEVKPDCGIASPTTCFSGGKQCDRKLMGIRNNMNEQDILDYAKNLKEDYIISDICGFCMLTKKSILEKAGVFDWKRYGNYNSEEKDLMWRLEKIGYKSYWVCGAYVHHYGHKTFDNMGIDPFSNLYKNRKILEERKKDTNLFIKNDAKIENIKVVDNEVIDVIIPTLDRKEQTHRTLEALFTSNKNINVIIVDNGSDDLGYLDKFKVKLIKNNKNLGIIKALNRGLEEAKSRYIVCMHNDIAIHTKDWINKAISFMDKNERIGIVGAAGWKQLKTNGSYYHLRTLIDFYNLPPRKEFERVATVDGCCMIIRNIGLGFDEQYGLFHLYDHDLCMQYRIRGYGLFVMQGSATHYSDIRKNSTVHTNKKYTSLRGKSEVAYYKEREKMFVNKWREYLPINVGENY